MTERKMPGDIPTYPNLDSVMIEEVDEQGDFRFGFIAGDQDPGLCMEKMRPMIPENIRSRLKGLYWFFDEYWRDKGVPQEQLTFVIPGLDHPINLYNYNHPLTATHIQEFQGVLGYFSQVYNGEALKNLRYILVDNIQDFNELSQEPTYGAIPEANVDGRMLLYPRAFEPLPYKRIPQATALTATLVHELTHRLTKYLFDTWVETPEFGWVNTKADQGQGYLYKNYYITVNPEACVNSYGASNPDEDIAESMVAYWAQPELLHHKKLRILADKVGVIHQRNDINVQGYSGNAIKLPTMDRITYMFVQRDKKVT